MIKEQLNKAMAFASKKARKLKKKLFNPTATDTDNKLILGDTTNLLNLANIKRPYYINLIYKAYANNWLPHKVSDMSADKQCYINVLTDEERRAYNGVISFLVFLDSVQTNNLPNISELITSPEIVTWLARQTYEESIHSISYGYILSEMLTIEEANKIVYLWRDDPISLERNSYIAELYENNKDKNTEKAFFILLIANYLLEGLYFYNGFMLFHNFAFRGLMTATNIQIKYIKRDEQIHCAAFRQILKDFKKEFPEHFDEELFYELTKKAVEQEIKFSNHFIGDKILGMNKQTIEDYTYYLANKRLKDVGLAAIFPERANPYKHLDKIAAIEDESENKANTFEVSNINYKSPEILKGWDKILTDD